MRRAILPAVIPGRRTTVAEHTGLKPRWERKFIEGKMFERMECDRCRAPFNFAQHPRATRIARCPACGSLASHPRAA